jgi:hypothetical protein
MVVVTPAGILGEETPEGVHVPGGECCSDLFSEVGISDR